MRGGQQAGVVELVHLPGTGADVVVDLGGEHEEPEGVGHLGGVECGQFGGLAWGVDVVAVGVEPEEAVVADGDASVGAEHGRLDGVAAGAVAHMQRGGGAGVVDECGADVPVQVAERLARQRVQGPGLGARVRREDRLGDAEQAVGQVDGVEQASAEGAGAGGANDRDADAAHAAEVLEDFAEVEHAGCQAGEGEILAPRPGQAACGAGWRAGGVADLGELHERAGQRFKGNDLDAPVASGVEFLGVCARHRAGAGECTGGGDEHKSLGGRGDRGTQVGGGGDVEGLCDGGAEGWFGAARVRDVEVGSLG